MTTPPFISLIVPTRQRPHELRRLLASLADTATHSDALEVILVSDADDPASREVIEPRLAVRHVIVPRGETMGALNMAGYEASRGRYLMLLNDDVVARTPGWDAAVRTCFAAYPDDLVLVHVNDLLLQQHLCAFPMVSRTFCEITGGICPRDYVRYRIDDHIEDIFNLLNVLGERRIVYTPDVIFEHFNHEERQPGLRQYFAQPNVLAVDAPLFERGFQRRKELALQLKARIVGRAHVPMRWRRRLDAVADAFALRTQHRQRVLTKGGIVDPWDWKLTLWQRVRRCTQEKGWRGLLNAVGQRLGINSARQ